MCAACPHEAHPRLPAAAPRAAVAVLESSSFAQVMMLSFGVKMRFAFHVFVNLFHLAVSAVVNDRICDAAWPRIPGAGVGVGGWEAVLPGGARALATCLPVAGWAPACPACAAVPCTLRCVAYLPASGARTSGPHTPCRTNPPVQVGSATQACWRSKWAPALSFRARWCTSRSGARGAYFSRPWSTNTPSCGG